MNLGVLLYVVNVHPVYSVEMCITRGIPLCERMGLYFNAEWFH